MKIKNFFIAGLMAIAVMATAGAARAQGVRMFVRHEVADYGVWKKAFDGFAPTQKKMGVVFNAVYRSTENPNDVTVIHDFRSLEIAKAFAALPELKSAMEKGGVKGGPEIWYTTNSTKQEMQEMCGRVSPRNPSRQLKVHLSSISGLALGWQFSLRFPQCLFPDCTPSPQAAGTRFRQSPDMKVAVRGKPSANDW